MSNYFIEFAQTPTSYNATQLVSVDTLRGVLIRSSGQVELSPAYLSSRGLKGHVVFKVYRDVDGVREVYYKHQGYAKPHISTQLDAMLDPELEEKLV